MANKLYFTKSSNCFFGFSTQDSNVVEDKTNLNSIEVSDSIINEIKIFKRFPETLDGSTVNYTVRPEFTTVDEATAQGINDETYKCPEPPTVSYPNSKRIFSDERYGICNMIQEKLDQFSNHPLQSQAEAYINYLKGIDVDSMSVTWPLSKYVGEYALDNGQTVIHPAEII